MAAKDQDIIFSLQGGLKMDCKGKPESSTGGNVRYGKKQNVMVNKIREICGDLADKVIMDMGCDVNGLLIKALSDNFKPQFIYGVNPSVIKEEKNDKYHLLKQDGTKESIIADNSVDVCVSLAAFEHFQDLPAALREINRVLKPGGVLYSEFGPIYSGCWGHHLWVQHEGKAYTYINQPLPPFCHLLMTESSLFDHCEENIGYSSALSDKIVGFVFKSEEQNRLFFEDYDKIIKDSPLDILTFSGHQSLPYKPEYKPESYVRLFGELRERFPQNYGFSYNAISMLMMKPQQS